MLAFAATVCFIIALITPTLAGINLVTLGLAFAAAHLLFDGWAPWRRSP